MSTNVLIVAIVGGILCLDRIFAQVLISRPIVAAPVIGLILGDPYTGLIAGMFIELLWIDRLPIGTCILPNDTIAAVLIAASSIESGLILGHLSQGLIASAVLVFIPLAFLAQKMELWVIKANERLARNAVSGAAHSDIRSVSRNQIRAALKGWLFPTGMILIALPLGIGVMTWGYPRLMPWATRGMDMLYGFIPLIGVAVALNTMNIRGKFPIICALFIAMTFVLHYIRAV
jgi:PTS system mannose-specific IIC component